MLGGVRRADRRPALRNGNAAQGGLAPPPRRATLEGRESSIAHAARATHANVRGRALVRDAVGDDVKAEYRRYTEQAIGRGVFGSPFYFFEGERFWGQDRLEQLERAIEKARWEKKRATAGTKPDAE